MGQAGKKLRETSSEKKQLKVKINVRSIITKIILFIIFSFLFVQSLSWLIYSLNQCHPYPGQYTYYCQSQTTVPQETTTTFSQIYTPTFSTGILGALILYLGKKIIDDCYPSFKKITLYPFVFIINCVRRHTKRHKRSTKKS